MVFSARAVVGISLAAFGLGLSTGVLSVKGARELFASMFESERPADVARPRKLERRAFRLEYPGNWKVDAEGEGNDRDRSFTVDSPGSSHVQFQIADMELDPQETVDAHADAQMNTVMKDARRTPFTRWGKYTGVGVVLEGRILGFLRGSIRVFCFGEGGQTFTIIEHSYDEDAKQVQPGFKLIERTFAVKAQEASP